MFAAGDDGTGGNCSDSNRFTPDFPSGSPWVTAVGGTIGGIPGKSPTDEIADSISTSGGVLWCGALWCAVHAVADGSCCGRWRLSAGCAACRCCVFGWHTWNICSFTCPASLSVCFAMLLPRAPFPQAAGASLTTGPSQVRVCPGRRVCPAHVSVGCCSPEPARAPHTSHRVPHTAAVRPSHRHTPPFRAHS
jgi:hypothetical protein